MTRWIALAAVFALMGCRGEAPLPVGVKRPSATAACQVPVPSDQSADALYRLAREIDARVCEEATGSSFIFPVNQACDEEAIGVTGTRLTLEEAGAKLQTCNVMFSQRAPAGDFTTFIQLKAPHPSAGQARDADIRLQDIAGRVPLGAATVQMENGAACFHYDDAPDFRRRLTELERYLPKDAIVRHFDDRRCAALLILQRRRG